ncbi:MAG TPA: NADPH-dependent FMN reductase [Rhodocyclaceae bacterium]|nr:NADPH-dependent FMN reductase [Rhodocyclaceae bacterium]
MAIVTIAGSPTANSRSAALLGLATQRLRADGFRTENIAVRDLPAAELLAANAKNDRIAAALRTVAEANIVIIATPVYKASYSGLLKSFLDLLPQTGFADKAVLPIATGGSSAHLLALDYALRPVLAALGARIVVESLFVADSQIRIEAQGALTLEPPLLARFDNALSSLQQAYGWLTGDIAQLGATLDAANSKFPVFAV